MDGLNQFVIKANVGRYLKTNHISIISLFVNTSSNKRSCWAFSSSSALSFYIYNTTNVNYVLSPQNLVDCSGMYGNQGCNGGWPTFAFEYIVAQKQALESTYPYQGVTVWIFFILIKKNNQIECVIFLLWLKNQCNNNTLKSVPLFGSTSFVSVDQNRDAFKQVYYLKRY